jgi:hypothetical protein
MLKLLFTFLLLNAYSFNMSKKNINLEKILLFEIDFQDFFENDRASLRLNNCIIFENVQLVSDKSEGLTDIILKGYWCEKNKIEIIFKKKSVICNFSEHKIDLLILFNNKEKPYLIDLRKGKYLGFSKKNSDELVFNQSLKPFVYD